MSILTDPAMLAVLTSSIVAISTVIIQPLISMWVDYIKWKREQGDKERERIERSATILLDKLSPFVVNAIPVERLRAKEMHQQLLAAYYEWHYIISSCFRSRPLLWKRKSHYVNLKTLNDLKSNIELLDTNELSREGEAMASDINYLSQIALRRT